MIDFAGKMWLFDGVYQKAETCYKMVPRAWGKLLTRAREVTEQFASVWATTLGNGYEQYLCMSDMIFRNEVASLSDCTCLIIDLLLTNKEEELNSIIAELRKNYASLQEKFTKEELDKMVSKVVLIFNVAGWFMLIDVNI